MSVKKINPNEETTVKIATDDAVGVPQVQELHWFVAIVRHNMEKKLRDLLASEYEVYVASQSRLRISPSGRKKWVEAVVLHSKVFIHCSENERLRIVNHPYIYRFMTDPSGKPVNGHRPFAVISDKEIDTLKFMLGQSEYPVDFEPIQFTPGATVRVSRGALKGMVGTVIESPSQNKQIVIHLDLLGNARVSIPFSDLEVIGNQ